MNDLTLTPNSPPAKPTMPALSPALSERLDSTGSPDQAVKEIAGNLALREEARDALPALQRAATSKAGPDGVRAVLSRRFNVYQQPSRNEAEWAGWWSDYYDTCADLPLAALEAGMRAWVNHPDSEFLPKPGKLRQLAETTPCRSLLRFQRAKRALMIADGTGEVEHPKASPEDVEKIKRMAAETAAKLMPEAASKPALPSIAGQADERGLTPEMRALISRRQEEAG